MNFMLPPPYLLVGASHYDLQRVIRQRPRNAFASSHGIQTSRSSSVVRITGIALGWIGSTRLVCHPWAAREAGTAEGEDISAGMAGRLDMTRAS